MLAGRVRLNTFLAGVGITVTAAAVFCGPPLAKFLFPPAPARVPEVVEPIADLGAPADRMRTPPRPARSPVQDNAEAMAMGYRGQNIGTEKLKDVSAGLPYKINVYQDPGHATVNRLKIDRDRDERWDESWTFDQNGVTRKVSPQDNEEYGPPQVWIDSSWTEGSVSEETPALPPSAPPPDAATTREVDRIALGYVGMNIGAEKLQDVTAGKPFKINVYQDAGFSTVNRLKIDLDRDDKWDEKWTFDGNGVTRKVAPNDDEKYGASQTWSGQAWH